MPPVVSPVHPFRPLFLCAAGFASVGMLLWAAFLHLGWLPPVALPPALWHGHEMLFGFAGALVGGFLLTAAGNWTGVATTTRRSLATLVALWLAARCAMLLSAPLTLAAAFDLAYFLLLALLVARVIAKTRNRRNYFVVGVVLFYTALDACFFIGALRDAALASRALLGCVDLLTFLMIAIGGRVIPFFTERRLSQLRVTRHPPLDIAVNVGAAAVLFADLADLPSMPRGALFLALAVLTLWRLTGWRGWGCRGEPMLWVLHLGYLWLAISFALRGLGLIGVIAAPELETLHGITVGALGTLAAGMMTRVAQGHSGVTIAADRWLVAAFVLPSAAALLRLSGGAALWPLAATLWVACFALYLARIGPLLLRGAPR